MTTSLVARAPGIRARARSVLLPSLLALALAACSPMVASGGADAAAADDASGGPDAGPAEPCNGVDDDGDGQIDEGCTCQGGATQDCFVGDPSFAGHGACHAGVQTCVGGEFGAWGECVDPVGPEPETCDGVDNDCNGVVDDAPGGCVVNVTVNLDGDCLTASCPARAPYPVGCAITMSGGDDRGCVASRPTQAVVYFQEGDQCGAGHVTGTLKCSSTVGAALGPASCPINKPTAYYPTSSSGCP